MSELETVISRIPYFWYLLSGASICVFSIAMIGLAKSVRFLMCWLLRIQHSRWAVLIIIEFLISMVIAERLFFPVVGMGVFWKTSLLALIVLSISQMTLPSSHHCLLLRRDKHGTVGGSGGWTKKRFLGYSPHKKSWVIVKMSVDDNIRYLQRFAREILIMHEIIHHPNCSQIVADGRDFITMRYIPGTDLYSWGRKTMKNASSGELENGLVRIGIRACKGLNALYDRGVLAHRDVSPDNILVHIDEGKLNAVVIDYGTAKVGSNLMEQLEKLLEERGIPPADNTEGLDPLGKPFFRCKKPAMYAVEGDDVRSLARSLAFPAIERHLLSDRDRYRGMVEGDAVDLEALEEYVEATDSLEDMLAESLRSQDFRNVLLAAENGEHKTMRDFQSALKRIVVETEEAETPELATPVMEYGHDNKSIGRSMGVVSLLRRTAGVMVSLAIVFAMVYALTSFIHEEQRYPPVAGIEGVRQIGMQEEKTRMVNILVNGEDGNKAIQTYPMNELSETFDPSAKKAEIPTHRMPDASEAETEAMKAEGTEAEMREISFGEDQQSGQPQPEPSYWRLVFADAGEYDSVKVAYREGEIEPEKKGQLWEFRVPNDVSSVEVRYRKSKIVIPRSSADTLYLKNYFEKSPQETE